MCTCSQFMFKKYGHKSEQIIAQQIAIHCVLYNELRIPFSLCTVSSSPAVKHHDISYNTAILCDVWYQWKERGQGWLPQGGL